MVVVRRCLFRHFVGDHIPTNEPQKEHRIVLTIVEALLEA
jgi:hypothetical protein